MNHPILNHKATFVARPYTNVVTLCFDIGLSLLPIKRLAHHALTQGLEPTVLTWRILAGGTDSYSVVTHRPPRALALRWRFQASWRVPPPGRRTAAELAVIPQPVCSRPMWPKAASPTLA